MCGFAFHAPPELVELKVQGTDSCVVEYEANGCSFIGDYGFYSGSFDQLTDLPGYQQMNVVIDGQNAVLASYGPIDAPPRPYIAGVHFPTLPAGAGVKLTFSASCDSTASQEIALRVFRTLTFGH